MTARTLTGLALLVAIATITIGTGHAVGASGHANTAYYKADGAKAGITVQFKQTDADNGTLDLMSDAGLTSVFVEGHSIPSGSSICVRLYELDVFDQTESLINTIYPNPSAIVYPYVVIWGDLQDNIMISGRVYKYKVASTFNGDTHVKIYTVNIANN